MLLLHFFPGVPWDAWGDLPYETVMGCISFIDAKLGGGDGDGD